MIQFSVQKLAKIAGVSIRTLHLYDQMGLLIPSTRTEAGYRLYSEKELVRLQQILIYKELDFSLKEIGDILDNPDFDLIQALENQKEVLKIRNKRLSDLIVTIDTTIHTLKKGNNMLKPEELYVELSKEKAEVYRNEAIEKYGKETIETAENKLRKLTKEQIADLTAEQREISSQLFALRDVDYRDGKVLKKIAQHYEITRKFWGTYGSLDSQADSYSGLGQLYLEDERFTLVDNKPQPEFALFLNKAMKYFSETILK